MWEGKCLTLMGHSWSEEPARSCLCLGLLLVFFLDGLCVRRGGVRCTESGGVSGLRFQGLLEVGALFLDTGLM